MIVLVRNGRGEEIDRVTITEKSVEYTTQQARELIESKIEAYGFSKALGILRSWSNGYVSTSEISE